MLDMQGQENRMPKTSDINLGERIFALFIGLPGSGKTLAGASFSGAGNVEFIDFDSRMKPVRLFYPEKQNISYTPFNMTNLEDFAYKYLPALMKNCPYKTVHLAGITSLTMTAITYQMNQKTGGDKLKKTKGGLMVPSWDEFNGEAMVVSQVLDALKSLPCNVIVEAHPVNRISVSDGSKYTSLVAFGPKVESLIPGYFDEIYYFSSYTDMNGDLVYKCRTKPGIDSPIAKTSLPLPAEFILSKEDGQPIPLYDEITKALEVHRIKLLSDSESVTE